jgi:hypothetical protein
MESNKMIKYIKAFYKTVKQAGKEAEYLLHAISSLVGYMVFGGIYEETKNSYIEYIAVAFAFIGIYCIFRLFYIMEKDNIKEFFKKVKNNVK